MKLRLSAAAILCASTLGIGVCAALPVGPEVARVSQLQMPEALVDASVQVHHKPGHVGGRGRHLGWYKKNRGKHKGWRR